MAAIRARWTSVGTSTQPGSQVRSSTECQGRSRQRPIRSARVDLPEPVTPYTMILDARAVRGVLTGAQPTHCSPLGRTNFDHHKNLWTRDYAGAARVL